jgi:hypothetical protein
LSARYGRRWHELPSIEENGLGSLPALGERK